MAKFSHFCGSSSSRLQRRAPPALSADLARWLTTTKSKKRCSLDVEQQLEVFGRTIVPSDEEEVLRAPASSSTGALPPLTKSLSPLPGPHRPHWYAHAQHLRAQRRRMLYLATSYHRSWRENVKFVMIDEVQDYTETQLWCF